MLQHKHSRHPQFPTRFSRYLYDLQLRALAGTMPYTVFRPYSHDRFRGTCVYSHTMDANRDGVPENLKLWGSSWGNIKGWNRQLLLKLPMRSTTPFHSGFYAFPLLGHDQSSDRLHLCYRRKRWWLAGDLRCLGRILGRQPLLFRPVPARSRSSFSYSRPYLALLYNAYHLQYTSKQAL